MLNKNFKSNLNSISKKYKNYNYYFLDNDENKRQIEKIFIYDENKILFEMINPWFKDVDNIIFEENISFKNNKDLDGSIFILENSDCKYVHLYIPNRITKFIKISESNLVSLAKKVEVFKSMSILFKYHEEMICSTESESLTKVKKNNISFKEGGIVSMLEKNNVNSMSRKYNNYNFYFLDNLSKIKEVKKIYIYDKKNIIFEMSNPWFDGVNSIKFDDINFKECKEFDDSVFYMEMTNDKHIELYIPNSIAKFQKISEEQTNGFYKKIEIYKSSNESFNYHEEKVYKVENNDFLKKIKESCLIIKK